MKCLIQAFLKRNPAYIYITLLHVLNSLFHFFRIKITLSKNKNNIFFDVEVLTIILKHKVLIETLITDFVLLFLIVVSVLCHG